MIIKDHEINWDTTGYVASSRICRDTRAVQNLLAELKYGNELVTNVKTVKYSATEIAVSWYKLQPLKTK